MIPSQADNMTRVGFKVLGLLGAIVGLYWGKSVLIPMIIALLLVAILSPAALWLHQRLKIRWSLACLTVIFGLVLFNVMLTMSFIVAGFRIVQQLPSAKDEAQLLKVYANFRDKLENISPVEMDEILFPKHPSSVSEIKAYQQLSEWAPTVAREVAISLFGWSWQWVLVLFILLFLLIEGRVLSRRVVEIFGPTDEIKTKVTEILADMGRQVRTYLIWRTIINFGMALLLGVVYHIAGLQQGWTWALLLAILNYIPYLGAILAGAPPFLDAFVSSSAWVAMVVLIVYAVIVVIEGYIVVPLLMGRSMDLNASTVMIACLFWELLWGVVGLFLAMPLMAGIRAVCFHIPELKPWAALMSSTDEEPSPIVLPKPAPVSQTTIESPQPAVSAEGAAKYGLDQ